MRPDDATAWPLPEHGRRVDEVRREIESLCARDHSYQDGTVFNSICSEPLPVASAVFRKYLEMNLGDNRIFPSLHEVERRITGMLGDLMGHPAACGGIVSGGTEANLLALASALRTFRARRPGVRPRVLASEGVHFSFDKIAGLLDVEVVHARLDERYHVDLEDLRRRVADDIALIAVTAGTSECGAVDDVPAVAAIAREAGIPLHVDAATGGFLVPFARQLGHPLPPVDFSVPGVRSITLDPHKYGGAPIPGGYLLFREREDLERLVFESHYRGTFRHTSLLGTRPGASVLAIYAALSAMGREGYQQQAKALFDARAHLLELFESHGYPLAYPPDLTIVGIRVPSPVKVLERLEADGIIASMSRRYEFLRIVVHRHLTLADYDRLVRHLDGLRPGGAGA